MKKKVTINKIRDKLGLTEYHKIGPDQKREVYYGKSDLVKMVQSNEGGYTDASSQKPLIGTYGLGPRIAIIGYNSKTKTAFISHNVEHASPEKINNSLIKNVGKNNLEIYLVGNNLRENHEEKLIRYLESELTNPEIVYKDTKRISDPKGLGKSIIMDTRDGKIYSHNGIVDFDF